MTSGDPDPVGLEEVAGLDLVYLAGLVVLEGYSLFTESKATSILEYN